MKLDLILSGVGGQGILSIAYLIDAAALNKGLNLKQAEVHGMSQRGGGVYSHLRVSSNAIMSDLIPDGKADMILSMEPLEVGRYLNALHRDGVVISSSTQFINIPNYPDEQSLMRSLFRLGNVMLVDAKAIALKAGAPLAQNVAMVGFATPYLPFERKDFAPVIESLFSRKGERVVNANLQALDFGIAAGEFFHGLLKAGISAQSAFFVLRSIDPALVTPEAVPQFAKKMLGSEYKLTAPLGENLKCDASILG